MGVFSPQGITDVGRMLLSAVQSGAAILDATKIVIGSGAMPSGATVASMTAVVTPVKELEITKKKSTNDGKAIFGGVYDNADITTAFYFREFALYARPMYVAADGTKTYGDEVLYAYGNAGNTADLMPAYSTSTVIEKELDMIVWVGNSATVNLEVPSGSYVTRPEVVEMIAAITPEDIGAMKLNDGFVEAVKSGTDRIARMVSYNNYAEEVDFINFLDSLNYFGIRVGKEMDPIEDSLKVARMLNGVWSAYRIYHEGNKPTPSDIGAPPIVDALSSAFDMDAIIQSGPHFRFYNTNYNTLGTPYAKNVTTSASGIILSYASSPEHGIQIAFLSGGEMYFRTMPNKVLNDWVSFYHRGNVRAGTADITAGTSALASGSYYHVYE